ncbi:unnamed protein product [Effrenium voratum]|nr:unnamed protein product [Effrenium voratum]
MAEEVQTVSEKLLELARASADSEMVEAAAREAREVHQLLSSELTRLSGDWQDLGRSACVGSLRRSLDNRSLVNLGNISTQESLNWRRHPELARLFGKSGDISTRSVLNSTLTDASEILEGLSRRRELRRQLRKLRQALAEAQAASEVGTDAPGSNPNLVIIDLGTALSTKDPSAEIQNLPTSVHLEYFKLSDISTRPTYAFDSFSAAASLLSLASFDEWRRERGLLDDKDFAFAFSTYEQEESLVPDAAQFPSSSVAASALGEPQPEVVAEQAVWLGLVLQQAGGVPATGPAAHQAMTVQNALRTWPMHYSGARYLLSFKQKFVALGALKTLQDFTSWEGIPTVQLEPSKKAGEVFAGRAQARDDVSLHAQWSPTLRPLPAGHMQGRRGGVQSGASVRCCPPDGPVFSLPSATCEEAWPGQGGESAREDQHFDDLARQGRKVEPLMLALSLRSGGKLWLSGLPTQDNLGDFPAVALQVTAFKQKPQERGGLVLPGVIQVQMPITFRGDRDGAWRTHWPTIAQSLYGGDELHGGSPSRCRVGGAGASLVREHLLGGVSAADQQTAAHRLSGLCRAADWAPNPVAVAGDAPLCMFKQSAPNAEARLQGALLFDNIFEALAVGRMMPRVTRRAGWPGWVMASLPLVPREGSTIQATLEALALNFTLDEGIVQALLKCKIQSLKEFWFLFNTEEQIQVWVSKLGLGEESMVQTARLRRAWNAVSLYYRQSEQDRSRVSVEDLDALLADGELRETKVAFWRRYRLRFPPEVHPSDSTVSRVSREMAKRMLCVFNVWKVRSLQFQLTTVQRKRKLAEGLYTEETNKEEPIFQDWEGYLDKLHTLMVAYSMAGALPLARRLQWWLQAKDVDERSERVTRFRESTASLGVVIKEVYAAQDAHWAVGVQEPQAASSQVAPAPASKAAASTNLLTQGKPYWRSPGGPDHARRDADLPGLPARQVRRQRQVHARGTSLRSRDPG